MTPRNTSSRNRHRDSQNTIVLTDDQVKTLAKELVREALLDLGIRADDDASKIEMQSDFRYLRELRTSVALMRHIGVKTVMIVFITGALGIMALGFKRWIGL